MFLWTDKKLWVDVGTTARNESVAAFTLSTWSHVAVVFDGSQPAETRISIYVNGVLDRTASYADEAVPVTPAHLLVGNLPNGSDKFVGLIDEVAVWSRALAATEIAAVYGAKAPL